MIYCVPETGRKLIGGWIKEGFPWFSRANLKRIQKKETLYLDSCLES